MSRYAGCKTKGSWVSRIKASDKSARRPQQSLIKRLKTINFPNKIFIYLFLHDDVHRALRKSVPLRVGGQQDADFNQDLEKIF